MKIKDGVVMAGLKIEIRPVLIAANQIWKEHGQKLVITAALDGTHSAGSLHYYGYAVDLRTRYFSGLRESKLVAQELRDKLSNDYDVVVHSSHIHVEYDPK